MLDYQEEKKLLIVIIVKFVRIVKFNVVDSPKKRLKKCCKKCQNCKRTMTPFFVDLETEELFPSGNFNLL